MSIINGILSQHEVSEGVFIPDVSDWYNISGVSIGLGSVVRNGGVSWGNTANFFIANANQDFILKYNPNSTYSIGFLGIKDDSTAGYLPTYAFYNNQSNLDIREGWTVKATGLGSWNTATLFEIKRENGIISFWMNGTLKYTSITPFTGAIKFGCSCYHLNMGANNIEIHYL